MEVKIFQYAMVIFIFIILPFVHFVVNVREEVFVVVAFRLHLLILFYVFQHLLLLKVVSHSLACAIQTLRVDSLESLSAAQTTMAIHR